MQPNKPTVAQSTRPAGSMGTFAGVFTPSILTILGLILFLRLGYVVGHAGLGRALLIIGIANVISVLTAISLSAVATNLNVKGGGDYYLISRTLGLEFGGALGVVLFLAQALSIGFYCIGFGETVAAFFPVEIPHLSQLIALGAVALLFVLAWLGADWASRFQFGVMAILLLALVSFFLGAVPAWNASFLSENWSTPAGGPSFWFLFAIFFPAVTGFTQGVSMSGDLKDPGKSLPAGTFCAVVLSFAIYVLAAICFAAASPRDALQNDFEVMGRVSRFAFLIDAGVIAATLSSAMASFLGGPRILQSLARDRIFPFLSPFASGAGPTENPRRAVWLAGSVALVTIAAGNLNVIASVVSMFFLISYGLLNYATFYEAQAASPSFRPRFRFFHKNLSLAGALGCGGAMLAINPVAGVVALAILFSVHQYLRRTAGPARWADSRRSFNLQKAREHLIAADHEPEHPRDWRPQIVVFSQTPGTREAVLRFASWIAGPSGLTTIVTVLKGEGPAMGKKRDLMAAELRKAVHAHHPEAFSRVVVTPVPRTATYPVIQATGTGPFAANTILFHWNDLLPGIQKAEERRNDPKNLRTAYRLGCNIVTLVTSEEGWRSLRDLPPENRRIDVWWRGDATSRLMLLLAHLMTRKDAWHDARIRVLQTEADASYEDSVKNLTETLQGSRISAEPEVVSDAGADVVVEQSSNAAVVFLPFRFRKSELLGPFGHPVDALIHRLPTSALCLAARDIELDAEPEEGKAAEMAEAFHEFREARKRAVEADKDAKGAQESSQQAFRDLYKAALASKNEEQVAEQKATAFKAREEAERAIRRAARSQAKLDHTRARLEALDVAVPDDKDEEEQK